MQKTVELMTRLLIRDDGNIQRLTVDELKEIETAAQVDRWYIEAKGKETENDT